MAAGHWPLRRECVSHADRPAYKLPDGAVTAGDFRRSWHREWWLSARAPAILARRALP